MVERAEHHGKRQALAVDGGDATATTTTTAAPTTARDDTAASTKSTSSSYWGSIAAFLTFKREPTTTIAATPTRDEAIVLDHPTTLLDPNDDSSNNNVSSSSHGSGSLAAYQSVLQQMENCLVWIMQPVLHGVPGVADSILVERERFLALSHDDVERAVAAVLADTRSFATRITEVSFSMAFGMPAAILTPIWRNLRAVALVASLYGHDVASEQVQAEIMWCLVEGEAFGRVPRVALRKVVRKVVKHLVRRTLSRAGAKIVGSVLPVGLVYEMCVDTSAATHIYERALQHFRPKDDEAVVVVDATQPIDENHALASSSRLPSSKRPPLRESRSIAVLSPARANTSSPLPPRGGAVWSLPEMSASMWLSYSFPSPTAAGSTSSRPRSAIEASLRSTTTLASSPSAPLGSRTRRSTTSSISSSLSLAKP